MFSWKSRHAPVPCGQPLTYAVPLVRCGLFELPPVLLRRFLGGPQRTAARGASEHGRRSKRWYKKPGMGSTRRRRSCTHGPRGRTPTRVLPATRARSASLSSTPRPWTRRSASGLQRQGHAFKQHELKAEAERAKHRAQGTGPCSGFGRERCGHRATIRPPVMPPRTPSTSRPTPQRPRSTSAHVGYPERCLGARHSSRQHDRGRRTQPSTTTSSRPSLPPTWA
jgi:hypothetical protein